MLLTTGYAEAPEDGRVGDGFEMIIKPYRRGELARRVRQLLDGKYGGG